jgi:3-isopropylmalate/(R)-2-methylmalate dehydratase large subunit
MHVTVEGPLAHGLTSKDVIMALIGRIGAAGATGYAIEFSGSTIDALSVEARMTICNMAVEAGARGAFMAPDEKVFAYLKDKPRAPKGELWNQAVAVWRELRSDPDARFDQQVRLDTHDLQPMVTWGTSPDQTAAIDARVPDPEAISDLILRQDMRRALDYMGLQAGLALTDIRISHAFIGSCTNARIEDLRDAARVVRGRQVAKHVRAMIVPGSTAVRDQAEAEGLATIFREAGFEWRQSGCSMCLAMNDDVLAPGDRCASSTNRNFEGRQGAGARTHLMSPAMVAAAAISGHLTDVRHFQESTPA